MNRTNQHVEKYIHKGLHNGQIAAKLGRTLMHELTERIESIRKAI